MRIAVWHNLLSGGARRALYYHILALQQMGHHVEVWSPDTAKCDLLPFGNIVIEHKLPLQENLSKIKYQTLGIYNPIKVLKSKIDLLKAHCKECVREIESNNFDIIFANSCSIFYMSYIGLFSTLPCCIYLGEPYRYLYEAAPHNVWQAPNLDGFSLIKKIKLSVRDMLGLFANRIQVREEIDSAKSYKKVLVNSSYTRESVLKAYGQNSDVCYLGVDTNKFNNRNINKEPYVVGMGLLYPLKSIERAIQVIAKIDSYNRPPLYWIANGADTHYLDSLKTLAINENVVFHSLINISDEQVVEVVSKAAVMLYLPKLEPFGFAPLEANACGTAVVGIAEGGLRETIVNGVNGFIALNFDINLISSLVAKFIVSAEFAKEFGLRARKHVEQNWSLTNLALNINGAISS